MSYSPRLNELTAAVRRLTGGWRPVAAVAACLPAAVLAGPEGEVVVSGAVTVSRPDGKTTQVQQASEQSILNWRSFSIAGDEYVQFVQPGSGSVSLNRVVGGSPSEILGRLSANGQVFLVNPRGIYFGPGARVDVSGLVASVLDIRDEDFLSGRYVFAQATDTAGARVVNAGTITAADGGYVVLAGEGAVNEGLIEARLGTVVLASGAQMTLDVSGTGLVDFAVDAAAVGEAAGVANVGAIVADGGRVLMSAKVAEGLVATAVNNEGLIRAHGIEERDGQVYLRAAGGDIEQSGTIDVSGEGGQAGGRVIVKGDHDITLTGGSRIEADGDGTASGGTVRVIADGALDVRPDSVVSADGGHGGFIELSGHEELNLRGAIALGPDGQLVIDPLTLTITVALAGDIVTLLNGGVDVTLVADDLIAADPGTSIVSTNPFGDLALRIGTVAAGAGSLGGISSAGPSGSLNFSCLSDGVCGGGGSFAFTPGSSGDIDIADLHIDIAGVFKAEGGTSTGVVRVGDVRAGKNIVISGNGIEVYGLVESLQTGTSAVALDAGSYAWTLGGEIRALNGEVAFFGHGSSTSVDATVNAQALYFQADSGWMDVDVYNLHGANSSVFFSAAGGNFSDVSLTTEFGTDLLSNLTADWIRFEVFGGYLDLHGNTLDAYGIDLLAWDEPGAPGDIFADGANLYSWNWIDIDADGLASVTGALLDADDIHLKGWGGVDLSGASVSAYNLLEVRSWGNVVAPGAMLDAGAMNMDAWGNLDLSGANLTIWGSPYFDAPLEIGDYGLITEMIERGFNVPAPWDATGVFRAGDTVSIGSLTLASDIPYVAFYVGNSLQLGSVSLPYATDVVAQFTSYFFEQPIGIEDQLAPLQTVNFANIEHFSVFGGTTIVVGDSLQFIVVVIGDNGPLDLGDKNFICYTVNCVGLDKIISTGRVISLDPITDFWLPFFEEFAEAADEDDDDASAAEDEGEGGEGEDDTVEQSSDSEKMCS